MKRSPFLPTWTIPQTLKQWPYAKTAKTWGIWAIPLLSVVSVPLALSHWASQPQSSSSASAQLTPNNAPAIAALDSTSEKTHGQTAPLPPLSQLPDPIPASPELRQPVVLKPQTTIPNPTPVNPSSKPPLKATTLKNPDPLPTTQAKTKPAPASKPTTAASSAKPQPKIAKNKIAKKQAPIAQPAAYVPPPLEIRVGVVRGEASTVVGTSGQAYLQERTGKTLSVVTAGERLTVLPNGGGLSVGGRALPPVAWLTPAQGSFVFVGDRWYRGRVLLVSQGNEVVAVNYVDLEHYLTSVVGSEMHANAPMEALKAQAIAARSYALVHMIRPASDWYDLGDTQRWQVYKGLKSEYNTGLKAVGDTAGQVLSYRGGVVESLYASTDAIVSSVHKGRGMSQLGAYDLAKQGYNYQQILNRYYPGVILARVILQQ